MNGSERNIAVVALNAVSTRSLWLARALNARFCLIESAPPYIDLINKVMTLLKRLNPEEVIIQLPTGPLLFATLVAKAIRNSFKIVVDAHTGFLTARLGLSKHSVLNSPFKGLLKHVDLILLHNETNYYLIPRQLRSKAIVLYDPFYVIKDMLIDVKCIKPLDLSEYAVFPASWHGDEPLDTLITTWTEFQIPVPLVITGKPRWHILNKSRKYISNAKNIRFTGCLGHMDYLCLVSQSTLVISASTSDFDAQCSAYEALAFNKPVIASNSWALRSILKDSAIYFDVKDRHTLVEAVQTMLNNYDDYRSRICISASKLEKQIKAIIRNLHIDD